MIGTLYNYQYFSAGNYSSLYSSRGIDNNPIVMGGYTFIADSWSSIPTDVLGGKKIIEVPCDTGEYIDTGNREHHHQYDHSLCISVRCLKIRHWDYCIIG